MKIASCKPLTGAYIDVSLENGEHYSVHREIALEFDLPGREEIDAETLSAMVRASDVRRACQRALYLLDMQSYSYQMMFQKLSRNYDEEVCYTVMDKLCDMGVINDWKYAAQVSRKAFEVKLYGPRRIRETLYLKGIPKNVINSALLQYMDDDLQVENVLKLMEKKYSKLLSDKDNKQNVEKCKAALVRMGYGYSVIGEAVRIYFENEEE